VPTTWEILLDIWALEDRPEKYQNEAFVNTLTIETGLALMAACEKHQKKNKGEDTFGKDPPLPTRQLDGGPDNCADLLHPGRYGNQYLRTDQIFSQFQFSVRYEWKGALRNNDRFIFNLKEAFYRTSR
jgi:hypothetical protein